MLNRFLPLAIAFVSLTAALSACAQEQEEVPEEPCQDRCDNFAADGGTSVVCFKGEDIFYPGDEAGEGESLRICQPDGNWQRTQLCEREGVFFIEGTLDGEEVCTPEGWDANTAPYENCWNGGELYPMGMILGTMVCSPDGNWIKGIP